MHILDEAYIECKEPEGFVTRKVVPFKYSIESLRWLWEKLSKIDALFDDDNPNDIDTFILAMLDIRDDGTFSPNGLAWIVDDVGIIRITDIEAGNKAQVHITFWDGRLKGREPILRYLLAHAMDLFELDHVYAIVPVANRSLLFATERFGFKKEARLHEVYKKYGKMFDCNLYTYSKAEVMANGTH